ncbi:MAG: AAA family ATPase [Syntrophobacteraceae bacterium]|nr:AAA family ATPase [Syntrophobacteraceae bacterium]
MNRIKRIKISGFRRLLAVDLPVRPFMVFIGANGVGKTSFLDAFTMLSASASGNLNATLSQLGGIVSLLTSGKTDELSFLVDMEVPGHEPPGYDLRLATKGTGYSISREILSQPRKGHPNPY